MALGTTIPRQILKAEPHARAAELPGPTWERVASNFTFDRTAGSHALAAAGQRER